MSDSGGTGRGSRFKPNVRNVTRRGRSAATSAEGEAPAASTSTAPVSDETSEVKPEAAGPATPRLDSLHTAGRSVTRGGAAKMKFAPKVPTRRIKREVPADASSSPAATGVASLLGDTRGRGGRGRGDRGRGARGGRGRGRGRGEPAELTASGPFSLGPAAFQARRAAGSAFGGGGLAGRLPNDYEDALENVGPLGQAEDPTQDTDFFTHDSEVYAPSMISTKPKGDSVATTKAKVKAEVKVKVKAEETAEGGVAIEEEGIEEKVVEDGEAMEVDTKSEEEVKEETPATVFQPQVIEEAIGGTGDKLIFFQFPNILGDFKAPESGAEASTDAPAPPDTGAEETTEVKVKPEPGTKADTEAAVKPEPGSEDAAMATETETPAAEEDTERDGKIGKLLVYESGKVKMQLGEVLFDVDLGSPFSFQQQVTVVDAENRQAFALGQIQERMVCIPDLTTLLANVDIYRPDRPATPPPAAAGSDGGDESMAGS
ncbi:hypothetical protein IWQ60_001924 [Tieghemiomyces parasiticus]|uniref:DNA-directed RNA polymerase III subunit RPC4 n=1 Tax=Tieghemiomyces parasiticus TaxID=78921 RepID=A0A9W8E227_9FUNG|nr:hypothetical protein IWQ60_001924 [Tieghemiomyces parasiticus]